MHIGFDQLSRNQSDEVTRRILFVTVPIPQIIFNRGFLLDPLPHPVTRASVCAQRALRRERQCTCDSCGVWEITVGNAFPAAHGLIPSSDVA